MKEPLTKDEMPLIAVLMAECISDECGWCGPADESVHPKNDPDMLCCPECHERVYPYSESSQ